MRGVPEFHTSNHFQRHCNESEKLVIQAVDDPLHRICDCETYADFRLHIQQMIRIWPTVANKLLIIQEEILADDIGASEQQLGS